jgi:hypothetical protein
MAAACRTIAPTDIDGCTPVVDVAWLKAFARHFMEDMHEACNIWRHPDRLEPAQAAYNLALRRFRRARPWLRENLAGNDRLDLLSTPGTTIFYGVRRGPLPGDAASSAGSAVALVAHMGGEAMAIHLPELFPQRTTGWRLLLSSPGMVISAAQLDGAPITLEDSQALLLQPLQATATDGRPEG